MRRGVVVLLIIIAAVCAQTLPVFEVASVRRIVDAIPTATMSGDIPSGRLVLTNAHLSQMISIAYEIQSVRIQGIPSKIASEQYQISAKAADPGAGEPQIRLMLRSLLADRFKLRFHWEDRALPNYTLRVASDGLKLQAAQDGEGSDRCSRSLDGSRYELGCDHIRIQTLANALAVLLRSPVVDQTGLTANYNFTLSWDGDDPAGAVPDALERFGLKLEMKRVPTQVFVVDSAEAPSEN